MRDALSYAREAAELEVELERALEEMDGLYEEIEHLKRQLAETEAELVRERHSVYRPKDQGHEIHVGAEL